MWRAANDNSYVELRGQGGRRSGPAGDRRLRDGGAARRHERHGRPDGRGAAGVEQAGPAGTRRGIPLPRPRVRPRRPEVPAQARSPTRSRRASTSWSNSGSCRRKYKDPITGEDFQPVYQTAAPASSRAARRRDAGGAVLPGAGGTPAGAGGTPGGFGSSGGAPVGGTSTSGTGGTPSAGSRHAGAGRAGIIGVVSKSKATSIKIYNGRTRYDQWAVTYQDVKPGKGLPPDLLQALNATNAAAGAAGQGGAAQPFGGRHSRGRIRSAARGPPTRSAPAARTPLARVARPIRSAAADSVSRWPPAAHPRLRRVGPPRRSARPTRRRPARPPAAASSGRRPRRATRPGLGARGPGPSDSLVDWWQRACDEPSTDDRRDEVGQRRGQRVQQQVADAEEHRVDEAGAGEPGDRRAAASPPVCVRAVARSAPSRGPAATPACRTRRASRRVRAA